MDRTMASEAVGTGSIPVGTTNHKFFHICGPLKWNSREIGLLADFESLGVARKSLEVRVKMDK